MSTQDLRPPYHAVLSVQILTARFTFSAVLYLSLEPGAAERTFIVAISRRMLVYVAGCFNPTLENHV